MSDFENDALERGLAQLTAWEGDAEPQVWRSALKAASENRGQANGIVWRFLSWPTPKAVAAVLVIALIGVMVVGLLLPAIGEARNQAQVIVGSGTQVERSGAIASQRMDGFGDGGATVSSKNRSVTIVNDKLQPAQTAETTAGVHSAALMGNYYTPELAKDGRGLGDRQPGDDGSFAATQSERAVVRKATIQLITDDVAAAFMKAQHIVSEASGEYVQDSALTGSGETAQANLTLRVTVDRLSTVLNELRGLGTVAAENTSGEDVTAQIVDLEARLRNEQRIEKELLELLDKRTDAPLTDVLELHEQIGRVRNTIEQITAQRERLSRLVSLASVLVIIRTEAKPAAEPEEPKQQTLGEYFQQSVGDSWTSGLKYLSDSVAGFVQVIVGGVLWWVALVAAIIWLLPIVRRRLAGVP